MLGCHDSLGPCELSYLLEPRPHIWLGIVHSSGDNILRRFAYSRIWGLGILTISPGGVPGVHRILIHPCSGSLEGVLQAHRYLIDGLPVYSGSCCQAVSALREFYNAMPKE